MSKDSILPQVCVGLELRRIAEGALADGEISSRSVLSFVRTEIQRRAMRAKFLERGLAAAAAYERDGRGIDASELVERLQRKLDDAGARRTKTAS